MLSIGNFDGVHRGHLMLLARLIEEARARHLVAAVMTFEPHPREFFAPMTAPARLSSLREKLLAFTDAGVDEVCVIPFRRRFAALSADAFAEKVIARDLQARQVLIGDDFRYGAGRLGDFSTLRAAGHALGFSVKSMASVLDGEARISSSLVRARLAEGDFAGAARFLGRPYAMSGRVGHGQQLGRTLGFPTANLILGHAPLPFTGVFAVGVKLPDGRRWAGVANLGVRPTLDEGTKPRLEVHLFDFVGELYGERLSVEFIAKLRDTAKFPDLSSLKAQIAEDSRRARALFCDNLKGTITS
jgi:riboflavin kinase/FMN adenylyltransferase